MKNQNDNSKNEPMPKQCGGPKYMAKADQVRQKPKRFYETVSVKPNGNTYAIMLDDRPIKTPMKQLLAVNSAELAKAIAKEWETQTEEIDHESMIHTKLTNTALDRVIPRRQEIIDEIIAFAGSDLLCYRATEPQTLCESESRAWDPVIDWYKNTHNIHLKTTSGITHVSQEAKELQKIGSLLSEIDEFTLTAIHNITTLTGSALLSIGLILGPWQPDEIWQAAHIDEDYQIQRWGEDEQASHRRNERRQQYQYTYEFYKLAQT